LHRRSPTIVPPGQRVTLSEVDPNATHGVSSKPEARRQLKRRLERLNELQYLLYADGTRAVLVVLQAIDAGGKDGTIRNVMSGLNPAGCVVTSFKVPSGEERSHDFLWRIHKAVPPLGSVGVFNRSHYEDVLAARVHKLVPRAAWKSRYRQINEFERMLSQNGVAILKFFLHIDKEEQARRLRARLEDPTRNWKFSEGDLAERALWKDYMAAFEDAINECNTPWAPWHLVPANKKWYRDWAVAGALVDLMESLPLRYPKPAANLKKIVIR
jgi:PPK2 family polyphosphate:nucleotide phosphotransferase